MRATLATGNASPLREDGFTLIELMVVLAVLVMIAGVLPVAFDRALPARRVAATANRVLSAIRDAQSESLAHGKPVKLEISAAGLTRDGRLTVPFAASTHVTLVDPDGRGLAGFTTWPDGSAIAARIEIRERTHRRILVVSGTTGRVSVGTENDAT